MNLKLLALVILMISGASPSLWACDNQASVSPLLQNVQRIQSQCVKDIKKDLKKDGRAYVSQHIKICQLDAEILIQKWIDAASARDIKEAHLIVSEMDSNIKYQIAEKRPQ